LKKYAITGLIIFSHDYPTVVCAGCATVFFSSMAATTYFRPYKTRLHNGIKIIGEGCLLAVWMIYLLRFVPFQEVISKVTTITTSQVHQFL